MTFKSFMVMILRVVNLDFDPRWQQAMIVEMQTLEHMGLCFSTT